MSIPLWGAILILTKFIIYSCTATVTGGLFLLWLNKKNRFLQNKLIRLILAGSLLGLLLSILDFFLHVGQMAEEGMGGMVNPLFLNLLWDTSIGSNVLFRSSGFGLILLCFWSNRLLYVSINPTLLKTVTLCIGGLGCLLVVYSFTLLGHTVDLTTFFSVALGMHVLLGLLWLGSLWPLRKACYILQPKALQSLMHQFGRFMSILVAILVVIGIVMSIQLVGTIENLLTTAYGLTLLTKTLLVGVLLGLAALHKWCLVPSLSSDASVTILKVSITIEMVVGLIVLLVTSILTTNISPPL